MKTLESNLLKAQAALDTLLSVSWWTLSKDDEEVYASQLKDAMSGVEELQRRIAATEEVRNMAKAMKANTLF